MRILYSVNGHRYVPSEKTSAEAARRARRLHPLRGWAREIPPTTPQRYISGLTALNIASSDDPTGRGDWHREPTWWTAEYLGPDGIPYTTPLWGAQGTRTPTPGRPELRDARTALGEIEHPNGADREPVWAATLPQAVIDLAWQCLREGDDPPSRREVEGWLSQRGRLDAVRIAEEVARRIADGREGGEWNQWRKSALSTTNHEYE